MSVRTVFPCHAVAPGMKEVRMRNGEVVDADPEGDQEAEEEGDP